MLGVERWAFLPPCGAPSPRRASLGRALPFYALINGRSYATESLFLHVHRLAGTAGVNLADRLCRFRTVQSHRCARGGNRQGNRHCAFLHAHQREQPPFASCSRSRRDLAAIPNFPDAWRLHHSWLGAIESLGAGYTTFKATRKTTYHHCEICAGSSAPEILVISF